MASPSRVYFIRPVHESELEKGDFTQTESYAFGPSPLAKCALYVTADYDAQITLPETLNRPAVMLKSVMNAYDTNTISLKGVSLLLGGETNEFVLTAVFNQIVS